MKKFFIFTTILFSSLLSFSQVGIGTTTPNASAVLDIVSTNKGLLPPRVGNVVAVTAPVAGLMVYDISQQCMRYYNGTIWSACMGGIVPPTFTCGDVITDIDGNSYSTVDINGQCWMTSDLKVSRYPNGDAIPYIDSDAAWVTLGANDTDDAYAFYGDSNSNGTVDIAHPDYGALYSYAAAIGDNWARDNNPNQGVCPDGWHLPSHAEWTTLTTSLGGIGVAGGKMKETGNSHWKTPNTDATNSSGFNGLPAGYQFSYGAGVFFDITETVVWWSRTASSASRAENRSLIFSEGAVKNSTIPYYKSYGFCVRCIKD